MKENFPKPGEDNTEIQQVPIERPKVSQKKKSFFKSTAIQSLALFAALSGVYGGVTGYEQYQEKQRIQEVQKEGLDLENISKDFDVKIIISSTSHSIVHIKQIHRYGTLEKMEDEGIAPQVIRSQKEIEKLINDLSEQNGIKDFFDEGIAVDSKGKSEGLEFLEMLRDILDKKINNPNVSVVESADALVDLETLTLTPHEFDGPEGKAEGANAEALYTIKIGWEDLLKNINDAQAPERVGHKKSVSKKYAQFIESATRMGMFQKLVDGFQSDRSLVVNNPLIQGDNVYIMGAARKLYLDGKINLIPAETDEGNDEGTRAAHFTHDPNSDPNFQKTVTERNDIALARITSDPQFKNMKFIPVIFGAGHNFEDNIKNYNKGNPSDTLGLIEITPK